LRLSLLRLKSSHRVCCSVRVVIPTKRLPISYQILKYPEIWRNIGLGGPLDLNCLSVCFVLSFSIRFFLVTLNGGESRKVGELWPVVLFDLKAWPEPKAVSQDELRALMKQFKSTIKVAKQIGASQAFVWDKLSGRKWDPKKKHFTK